MKRKDPNDLLISYPTKRASPGVKAKARDKAIEAGEKSFYWNCPRHGMTVFSTAGAGVCRCCIADAQQKSRDHRNAAQRVRSAERKRAAMALAETMSQAVGTSVPQAAIDADTQRQNYLKALAAKIA
jgi:uncharacterized Zn finger protein (UPF0148 family)